MLPYLYIEDHGPTEVLLSGGLGTPFVWDPQLARHVHRFTSIEDFRARARDIINAETQWKVFPGLEAAPAPAPAPPLNNAHVAAGCEQFPSPDLSAVPDEDLRAEYLRRFPDSARPETPPATTAEPPPAARPAKSLKPAKTPKPEAKPR